ncbi:olfactory receptor 1020-like [Gambusia affinis]|uniref:olfactory receptor 1020-like n=1 Tax=Gambusia affinis TaxID=33528 RepID=UPI001CDB8ED3|nr:olfactory receptor 1020-like [Gambusia affinis]
MMETFSFDTDTHGHKDWRIIVNNKSEQGYVYNSFTLQLESLNVSGGSRYVAFVSILLSYVFIIVANVGVAVLVCVDRSLHQPMYLLFCSLTANDVFGNSVVLPRVLLDVMRPPADRLIGYYECVLQAFISHMFSTTCHTVLMAMAFDRYVAIGNPLRYSAIMTNRMVTQLTAASWGAALVLVGILLGLTVRLSRCRTFMRSLYCNNASLFLLSCEDVFINNMYGLTFTGVLFTASIGSMVVTYTKITVVCLTSKSATLNRKALKTCATHLLVYLILAVSGIIIIILQRFPDYAEEKKIAAVLFHIVPGALNPVIYGMQSKEIKKYFSRMFHTNKVLMSP